MERPGFLDRIATLFRSHPKVYFRDAGILHALLNLPATDAARAHPGVGASREGLARNRSFGSFAPTPANARSGAPTREPSSTC